MDEAWHGLGLCDVKVVAVVQRYRALAGKGTDNFADVNIRHQMSGASDQFINALGVVGHIFFVVLHGGSGTDEGVARDGRDQGQAFGFRAWAREHNRADGGRELLVQHTDIAVTALHAVLMNACQGGHIVGVDTGGVDHVAGSVISG